ANIALLAVYLTDRPATPAARSAAMDKVPASGAKADVANATAGDRGAAADATSASADPARDATLGRAFARFAEKMRAAQAASAGDGKWWRNRPTNGNLSREQLAQARRELADAMV